jgi:hypothetical protein
VYFIELAIAWYKGKNKPGRFPYLFDKQGGFFDVVCRVVVGKGVCAVEKRYGCRNLIRFFALMTILQVSAHAGNLLSGKVAKSVLPGVRALFCFCDQYGQ